MLGIFVRIITITLESSQGRFNLLLFPQGLVMLFDLLVLRWRYLWTHADGGGELASRRNKKTRDFTQPFPHKSTLLSIYGSQLNNSKPKLEVCIIENSKGCIRIGSNYRAPE